MRVEISEDKQSGTEIYRIWDIDCQIPKPKDVAKVEIKIDTNWEKMFFNKTWGDGYDSKHEGCWLKQKKSKYFKAQIGDHDYIVRFYPYDNYSFPLQTKSINDKEEGLKQLETKIMQLEQENIKLKNKLSKIQDVLNL
jgi:hypothetical protein